MPFSAAGGLSALQVFSRCGGYQASCGGLSYLRDPLGLIEFLGIFQLSPYCEDIPVTPQWPTEKQRNVPLKMCIGA